jgi:hypothetical protein
MKLSLSQASSTLVLSECAVTVSFVEITCNMTPGVGSNFRWTVVVCNHLCVHWELAQVFPVFEALSCAAIVLPSICCAFVVYAPMPFRRA